MDKELEKYYDDLITARANIEDVLTNRYKDKWIYRTTLKKSNKFYFKSSGRDEPSHPLVLKVIKARLASKSLYSPDFGKSFVIEGDSSYDGRRYCLTYTLGENEPDVFDTFEEARLHAELQQNN